MTLELKLYFNKITFLCVYYSTCDEMEYYSSIFSKLSEMSYSETNKLISVSRDKLLYAVRFQ